MEDTNLRKALEEFEATLGRKIPPYQDPEFDQFIKELRDQGHPMAEVIHMVSLEHAISEGYKPTEEEVASLQQQRSKAYLDERSIELATPPLPQRIANWFTVEKNGKRVPHRGKLAALVVGGGGIALAALLTPPSPQTQTAQKTTPPAAIGETQPTDLQPQLETAPTTEDPTLTGVSGAPADDGTVDASTLVAESPQQGYDTPIQDPALSGPSDPNYGNPGYSEGSQPTYQDPASTTPPPAPEGHFADAPSLPSMAPGGSQSAGQPQVVAPRPPAVVYRAQRSNETLPSSVVYPASQGKESAGGQQSNTQKPQLKIYQGQALPKPEKVSNIYGRQNNTPALQTQGGQKNPQQKTALAQNQQTGQQNQSAPLNQGQQKQTSIPTLKVYQAAPKQQNLQQNTQGSQQTGQKTAFQQTSNTSQGAQNKAFAVYNRQGNPGGGFNASNNTQQGGNEQNTVGQQGNSQYPQSYGGGQPNVTNTPKTGFVVYKNGSPSTQNTTQNTGNQEPALKKIYDRNAGGLQGSANPNTSGNGQVSGNATGGGQNAAPYTAGTQLTGTLITRVVTASGVKVPVIAKTNDGAVWVGSAGIDATKRITINFERVVIGGQEIKAKAVAFSSLGEPSLQASVSTTTPNLLPEVLRSSVGGVSNYVDALLNQKTVTLSGNGSVTQSGQVPSLGLMVGANVADLFKIEQNRATIIDIATVEKDTPIIIVTGVSSDGADGATKFD